MRKALVFVLGIFILFVSIAAAQEETLAAPKPEASHWELNFTFVRFFASGQFSAIKSVGYYFLPRYLSIVLSLSSINGGTSDADKEMAFSLNPCLNYPFFKGLFVPFISGGVGFSLKGTYVKNAGAGLKIRIASHAHVLVEYRLFEYVSGTLGSTGAKRSFDCLGLGVSYHD